MSESITSMGSRQRVHEARTVQLLRLPQELRETVLAILSDGDVTVEQLSAMTSRDVKECRGRLDELVRMGHLKERVFLGQKFYGTVYIIR